MKSFENFANKCAAQPLNPPTLLALWGMSIDVDAEYEIVNLEKRPDLNGTSVRVVSFIDDRVEVKVLTRVIEHNLSVRRENLKPRRLTQREMESKLAAHYGLVQK